MLSLNIDKMWTSNHFPDRPIEKRKASEQSEESGESGDEEESGESGESGDEEESGESGESGDEAESGESGEGAISKRSEIPEEKTG